MGTYCPLCLVGEIEPHRTCDGSPSCTWFFCPRCRYHFNPRTHEAVDRDWGNRVTWRD
jgi:hypothetical protein